MKRLACVLGVLGLSLFACDDDSGPPSDVVDAAAGADAPEGDVDAAPGTPDAPAGTPDARRSDGPPGPTVDAVYVDGAIGIPCGSETCDPATQQCCVDTNGPTYACIGSGDTCSGGSIVCDGPEDCPGAGTVCCVQLSPLQVSCQAADTCTVRLCHTPDDCPSQPCCPPSGQIPYSYCSPLGACY